jgi:hypothetical protein
MARADFQCLPQRRCDIMLGMRFLPIFGCSRRSSEAVEEVGAAEDMSDSSNSNGFGDEDFAVEESHLLRTFGWISAALGAVALGLIVGRELRVRYKFNRRTPYDMYAHSGDELPDTDWGVGI